MTVDDVRKTSAGKRPTVLGSYGCFVSVPDDGDQGGAG